MSRLSRALEDFRVCVVVVVRPDDGYSRTGLPENSANSEFETQTKRSCPENRRERPSRIGMPLPTVDRTRRLRSSRPTSLEPRRLRPFAQDGRDFVENRAVVGAKKDAAILGEAGLPVGYMLCV